jgi:hypothetical protein
LAAYMKPPEIAEATRLADEWRAANPKPTLP